MALIQTTGDLRKSLCELLDKSISGEIDNDKLRGALKVVSEINENMHAETRRQMLMFSAGQPVPEFGELRLYKTAAS